jgi:tetratricopeptide (TPR) repeat protein
MPGIGQANFGTYSVKAQVLHAMGRDDESKSTMQAALRLPNTLPAEIHQYGRQLQLGNRTAEAIDVFKFNAERNGDAWPVHVGLARAFMATGDNKQALEHAKIAVKQAPDEINRKNLEAMVEALSAGKPFTN